VSQQFPALEVEGFLGKRLGRFELLCKLGSGGMSEVFLAWQSAVGGFKRPVVIKRILDSVKRNEEFLRMFIKEAKITSALSHGGIAHLYELVRDDDELFMVMEFVPGATLVEVARACHVAHEPIPIGFSLSVLRDTALALHYAHTFVDPAGRARPIIHRDIAEKNIMVGLDGAMKLLDFGIARQLDTEGRTQIGTVKGTAGYMSPEQVRGEKLDGRTDVFSLGVVLHECLTGQRLFRRNTLPEEVQALLEAPIPAPSQKNREVPIEVDAVVMKALSRDKTYRYLTAKEMADAITTAARGELWDQSLRAEFLQRHFAVRQKDILALLGDPGATDLGDLLPESGRAVTRDEMKRTVSQRPSNPERALELRPSPPLGGNVQRDEETVEVRGIESAASPEPVTVAPRPSESARRVMRRGSMDFTPDDDADAKTVRAIPPNAGRDEIRTARAPPVGTVPGPPKATQRTDPELDLRSPLDERGTLMEESVDGDGGATDESSERRDAFRTTGRGNRIAAQKQALLMWIAIGSGLVLGVVLAAFLIFG
jgi:serine/threonine protein kinase